VVSLACCLWYEYRCVVFGCVVMFSSALRRW
jgi:hypothetical protein